MIKVAIADDHKLFREGIKFLINQFDDVILESEAADGEEALAMIQTNTPDVLLLDLDMPKMDGIAVLKQLRVEDSPVKVILLTMHNDPKMVAHLMELGANSYLLKDTSPEEFHKAIKTVMDEDFYFNEMVSKAMLGGLKNTNKKKPGLKTYDELSSRELEVLTLICQEYTTKEIAEELFISPRTAEGHRNNMIQKLGVKNTAGLIVKAIKEEIVQL